MNNCKSYKIIDKDYDGLSYFAIFIQCVGVLVIGLTIGRIIMSFL